MNKLKPKERAHTWYWSSTEYRPKLAWGQYFNSSIQSYYDKTSSIWTRAIRKVKK